MRTETWSRLERGATLIDLQRFELAEKELRLAAADEPQSADAHRLLALCLLRWATHNEDKPKTSVRSAPRLREATTEAELAVGLDPEDASSFRVLAECRLYLDRVNSAQQAIAEALRLDPENAWNHSLASCAWLQKKFHTKALEAADRGLALEPENSGCLANRISALIRLERFNAARETLGQAMARYPADPIFHQLQGELNLFSGNPAGARPHLRESLRLDPMDSTAKTNYELTTKLSQGNWTHVGNGRYRQVATVGGGLGIGLIIFMVVRMVIMVSGPNISKPPPTYHQPFAPSVQPLPTPPPPLSPWPPSGNSPGHDRPAPGYEATRPPAPKPTNAPSPGRPPSPRPSQSPPRSWPVPR